MFVPCTALLYDSTAATPTLKLFTALLSISCGVRLIPFLMMSSLVCQFFSQTLSVWEMRWCLISRTEHSPNFLNITLEYLRHNFLWDRLISRQTYNPWPCYSQNLNSPNYFLRGYLKDRVCEKNWQTREDIIRKGIRRTPQEMLNRAVNNFNVGVAAVLSYSSAVHGTNIVLITEKVY